MAIRTTAAAVQAVLGGDYGPLPDGTYPDLSPYIESVTGLVTQLAANVVTYRETTLSSSTLELIERWLAAWAYAMSDKTLSSTSKGGASGSFTGQWGMGLDSNNYGQMAIRIDYTRTLDAMDKGRIASTDWLGRMPSSQTPYSERN